MLSTMIDISSAMPLSKHVLPVTFGKKILSFIIQGT